MKRKLCAPRVGVWLVALATPTTAMTLGELADAVDAPRVGAVVELAGPLAVGRARFEVPAGGARVLLAGERPCGLVLSGGRLRYTVDDPQALPVARRNAGELGVDLSSGDPAVVDVALEEAVIWGWGLAPATDEAAPTVAGALPEWVARVLEHPLFLPPSIPLLAADRGLAPGARVALLRAGGRRFLYQLDPSDDRLEVLSVLDTLDSRAEIYKGRVPALQQGSLRPPRPAPGAHQQARSGAGRQGFHRLAARLPQELRPHLGCHPPPRRHPRPDHQAELATLVRALRLRHRDAGGEDAVSG